MPMAPRCESGPDNGRDVRRGVLLSRSRPPLVAPFLGQRISAPDSGLSGVGRGGHYEVLERMPCEPIEQGVIRCSITVRDDHIAALDMGWRERHLTIGSSGLPSVAAQSPAVRRPNMFRELSRPQQFSGWFVFISYAVGSPAMIAVEFRGEVVSQRFGLMPEFVYVVGLVQFVCAFLLFSPRMATWSLATLSVLSAGAVGLHLKIGSPLTGVPALAYTALQVWIAIQAYRKQGGDRLRT